METRKPRYIVFTTTTENNGTAILRDNLARLSPEFVPVRTYAALVTTVFFMRKELKCIFALSDTHYLVSVAITNLLGVKVPVVLGYFHPDQWKCTLNERYSRTQHRVMHGVIDTMELSNIVFSSHRGYEACNATLKSSAKANIIPGPVVQEPLSTTYTRDTGSLSVVTIGRFVEFKGVTLLAMIEVVERLRDLGKDVSYTMYGDGPFEGAIRSRIDSSRHKSAFVCCGPTSEDDFAGTALKYHVFFGMGGAVVRAAMLGIPSIIAIQREPNPICYGLFSDHDHETLPVFGDQEESLRPEDLYHLLLRLSCAEREQLLEIGEACKTAADVYSPGRNVKALRSTLDNSKILHHKVSVLDLITIRLETWASRKRGVCTLDA